MSNLLCVISLGVLVVSVNLLVIVRVLEKIADKSMDLHRIECALERIADKIESEDKK